MKCINAKTVLPPLVLAVLFSGQSSILRERTVTVQQLDETVVDYDGNSYRTVRIGDQIWLAENLKVTHYRDGTPIANVYDNEQWPRAAGGAYCMLNNDSLEYKKLYGLLYNFYAVTNSHGLPPQGWHIPSREECLILIEHLGGHALAGKKIKDNRANLWKNRSAEATNESGFCGLPAGGRGQFGSPGEEGSYATWWSFTSTDSQYAWHWGVFPDKPSIRSNPGHKASGFSVRCIKDMK